MGLGVRTGILDMNMRAGHMAAAVTAAVFLAVLCAGWYRPRRPAVVDEPPNCAVETNRARLELFGDDETDERIAAELGSSRLATAQVRLERSACDANCAVYSVTIHGDGAVDYEGIGNVAQVGRRSARIPQAWARRVFVKFIKAEFFAIRQEPERLIANAPTYRLTLELDGTTRALSFFAGNATLRLLAGLVDEAALTSRWVESPLHGAPPAGG